MYDIVDHIILHTSLEPQLHRRCSRSIVDTAGTLPALRFSIMYLRCITRPALSSGDQNIYIHIYITIGTIFLIVIIVFLIIIVILMKKYHYYYFYYCCYYYHYSNYYHSYCCYYYSYLVL